MKGQRGVLEEIIDVHLSCTALGMTQLGQDVVHNLVYRLIVVDGL